MAVDFNLFFVLEAGFAPTPDEDAVKMICLARLRKGEVFYDLGSGDGNLIIVAAKDFGARSVGVEIQKKLISYSRRRIKKLGLQKQVKVIMGDLFKTDISEADVVALYLMPTALGKLKLKLKNELKHGARIVVYKYPIEGWKPKEICRTSNSQESPMIFLYEV